MSGRRQQQDTCAHKPCPSETAEWTQWQQCQFGLRLHTAQVSKNGHPPRRGHPLRSERATMGSCAAWRMWSNGVLCPHTVNAALCMGHSGRRAMPPAAETEIVSYNISLAIEHEMRLRPGSPAGVQSHQCAGGHGRSCLRKKPRLHRGF
jgi:hypothetical protein